MIAHHTIADILTYDEELLKHCPLSVANNALALKNKEDNMYITRRVVDVEGVM